MSENVENNNVASGDMNNQIIDEEQTFGSKDNTSFTNEQLIEKIKIYLLFFRNEKVLVRKEK